MKIWLIITFSVLISLFLCCQSTAAYPTTERVSIASDGTQGDLDSASASISADGRYVAFTSGASNLVPDDTNKAYDIFVHDRISHTTERVSVGPGGVQANDDSRCAFISANGRYVVFNSEATNLVADDTNQQTDIFVHDRYTHTTELVSKGWAGAQSNGMSVWCAINENGRYVSFWSYASNLVADDTNNRADVFVYDRDTGLMERVSLGPGGAQGNSWSGGNCCPWISADGRYVVFDSAATNLVPDDTNRQNDLFVHDRILHLTERVNLGPGGVQANAVSAWPAISADGRYVVYYSQATNLVPDDTNALADVFLYDRITHQTQRISVGMGGTEATGGWSTFPVISANNRYVAFSSSATNLVPDDTNGFFDIFVCDLFTMTMERVSVGAAGEQGNGNSPFYTFPTISANGRYVAFESLATNLVASDTNGYADIFVRDRGEQDLAPGSLLATVSSSSESGYVNAGFKTVTMQKTGVPLWILAPALILVVCGLFKGAKFNYRKK
ncbi:MAG: PD40 domain-containing protein [Methanobacteriaceae archaeon]|nr:PD40 domain-containing protein [Methanobacteriaceae archaeon]